MPKRKPARDTHKPADIYAEARKNAEAEIARAAEVERRESPELDRRHRFEAAYRNVYISVRTPEGAIDYRQWGRNITALCEVAKRDGFADAVRAATSPDAGVAAALSLLKSGIDGGEAAVARRITELSRERNRSWMRAFSLDDVLMHIIEPDWRPVHERVRDTIEAKKLEEAGYPLLAVWPGRDHPDSPRPKWLPDNWRPVGWKSDVFPINDSDPAIRQWLDYHIEAEPQWEVAHRAFFEEPVSDIASDIFYDGWLLHEHLRRQGRATIEYPDVAPKRTWAELLDMLRRFRDALNGAPNDQSMAEVKQASGDDDEQQWLGPKSPKEWRVQFGMSASTFARRRKNGHLRVRRVDGNPKLVRIHVDDVKKYTREK